MDFVLKHPLAIKSLTYDCRCAKIASNQGSFAPLLPMQHYVAMDVRKYICIFMHMYSMCTFEFKTGAIILLDNNNLPAFN